jgi:type III secretion protein R
VLLVAALSLLPLVLLVLTSFVKMSVVLALVRNALGTPGMPPAIVTTGIALVLSFVVMAPVGQEMWDAAGPDARKAQTPGQLVDAAEKAKAPLVAFLAKHTHDADRQTFLDLSRKLSKTPSDVSDQDLQVLAPAFVTTELKGAFTIGFLLLLPFLVIDLLVASTLQSIGLVALPPNQVALPFKLLLFVLADGWLLVARGLVLGYT